MLVRQLARIPQRPWGQLVNYQAVPNWYSEQLLLQASSGIKGTRLGLCFNYADKTALSMAGKTFGTRYRQGDDYSLWPSGQVKTICRLQQDLTRQFLPSGSVVYGYLGSVTQEQLLPRCAELAKGGLLQLGQSDIAGLQAILGKHFTVVGRNGQDMLYCRQ